MRSVFFRSALASLLIVVLLAPGAFAADTGDGSLWSDFVAWVEAGLGIPEGITADELGFAVWLMIRPTIPGG